MNLLCPSCQKMLNVPDQYAGQLMKCPLCNGTFTVPTLAGSEPPAASDTYTMKEEPLPPPPPPPPAPDFIEPKQQQAPSTSAPLPSSGPSLGYTRTRTIWLSPRVLRWIPPVALLLIFILQFLPWVGVYPGGFPSVTQSAWGAGFATYTEDDDIKVSKGAGAVDLSQDLGASVLTVFYLLLMVLLVIPVTIAVVVLELVPLKLPAVLQPILPWRWGIVAALNLVAFLFLGLQLVLGFSLESVMREQAEKQIEKMKPDSTLEKKQAEMARGIVTQSLDRTAWLKTAVWLHLFAIISAALMFWLGQRGESRPLPRIELQW